MLDGIVRDAVLILRDKATDQDWDREAIASWDMTLAAAIEHGRWRLRIPDRPLRVGDEVAYWGEMGRVVGHAEGSRWPVVQLDGHGEGIPLAPNPLLLIDARGMDDFMECPCGRAIHPGNDMHCSLCGKGGCPRCLRQADDSDLLWCSECLSEAEDEGLGFPVAKRYRTDEERFKRFVAEKQAKARGGRACARRRGSP